MATKLATKEKEAVSVPPSRRLLVGPEDIDVQRINVIQKQSDLVQDAPVGSIYINRSQMIVAEDGEDIPVTVIKGDKMWKEDIPYDSDEIPRFAHTHEEYLELKNDSEYEVIECADITVLITQPEGESNTDITIDDSVFDCPLHAGYSFEKRPNKNGNFFWSHQDSTGAWCSANKFNELIPKDEIATAWSEQLLKSEISTDRNLTADCEGQPISEWLKHMVITRANYEYEQENGE